MSLLGTSEETHTSTLNFRNMGVPMFRGIILAATKIRVFWGLDWGPLVYGEYRARACPK